MESFQQIVVATATVAKQIWQQRNELSLFWIHIKSFRKNEASAFCFDRAYQVTIVGFVLYSYQIFLGKWIVCIVKKYVKQLNLFKIIVIAHLKKLTTWSENSLCSIIMILCGTLRAWGEQWTHFQVPFSNTEAKNSENELLYW